MTNTTSVYSVVLYGKEITDGGLFFIDWALSSIREFMGYDGLAFIYQRWVAPASGGVRFGKALNRSVTDSMNETSSDLRSCG